MRIVIYVQGGVVQNVLTDTPGIQAMIVDYDNEAVEECPHDRSFEIVEVNVEYIEKTTQGTEE